MTVCRQVNHLNRHISNYQCQLNLLSPADKQIKYWPAWLHEAKSGAFTSFGWQVTLCAPIWQVTLRSSETGSHEEPYYTPFIIFNDNDYTEFDGFRLMI